ncbi:NAD(P)-dependent oxidoreductase [Achromobacter deleyi]|uniref:NAD(P)-dependent oxidoreductase n=1 Tax=Achromobacter deleyi TaxID=1353891 RepID=UPI001492654C|nr:NAD(P)-dependent oxidoreductase [Achromobacter deleyi]QVQ26424.1 NAD(P)-dependent oxidoreductase [Achromobacter deleyi]UIP21992.1 NAD(P)-dependent oxidoreductase [Achromobacter deleyi]
MSEHASAIKDAPTPVGFVGLGVMGLGMAGCLLRKGFPLSVHNLHPERTAALCAAGAFAGTLAQVGERSRIVVLSLPDTAAVDDVLFGSAGLASTLPAGSCVIDTSTISADATRRIAKRLGDQGIAFLDAPVSGGQQGAADGTLSCMVGGDFQAFQTCAGVLAAFTSRAIYMGASGTGQVTKSCNQIAVSAALLGVAEALALATRQGVDPAQVREVLLGGAAQSFSLEKHGPRIIAGNFQPGFRATLMRKDLRLALDSGREGGVFMPVAGMAAQLLDILCNRDEGDLDWCALGGLVSELSGAANNRA